MPESSPPNGINRIIEPESDKLCNLCGLPRWVGYTETDGELGGVAMRAEGGYYSTPGNGSGALDDMTVYCFALCEFCLDFMFSQFVIPVDVECRLDESGHKTEWRPAMNRVLDRTFRPQSSDITAFVTEKARRDAARQEARMSTEKKTARAAFRSAVMARDGSKCVMCGQLAVDAHHITSRGEMPGGGYVPENGISLCGECHIAAERGDWTADELYVVIGSSFETALEAATEAFRKAHRDKSQAG